MPPSQTGGGGDDKDEGGMPRNQTWGEGGKHVDVVDW